MIDKDSINDAISDITNRISDTIENSPLKDLEKNVKAVASSVFDKMDLVSKDQLQNNEALMRHLFENIDEIERKCDALARSQRALAAVVEASYLGDRESEPLKSALAELASALESLDALDSKN